MLLVPIIALFVACSDDMVAKPYHPSQQEMLSFSVAFAESTKHRGITSAWLKTFFSKNDTLGIFVYKRNAEEESSISNNDLYVNNMKMVYNGSSWQLESPIFYIDDETVFDVYAYYPYQEGATADSLAYCADTGMVDLLVSSVLSIMRTENKKVHLLFSHLLSMVHVLIDKTEITPDFDETFVAYFHGVVGGAYNLETRELGNPLSREAQMLLIETDDDTRTRSYQILVPAQQLVLAVVFSFFQTTISKEISQAKITVEPIDLVQGQISLFNTTINPIVEKDVTYSLYDPFPIYGTPVGMVIEVSADGKSGKIISLKDLETVQWATSDFWVGSSDSWDGQSNKIKMQMVSDWETTFPALQQCLTLGESWYLPSIEEAYPYLRTMVDQLNAELAKIEGGEPIDTYGTYATSTEVSQTQVRKVYVQTGDSRASPKSSPYKIRAFYEFQV